MGRRPPANRSFVTAGLIAALVAPVPARAQASRAWGRIAFFSTTSSISQDGADSRSLGEFVTTVTYRSADAAASNVDFALDTRFAGYSGGSRDSRVSIYDAWAGARLMGGAVRIRGGQMWLNELGGIGAIAGGVAEYQRPLSSGHLRLAGFGGLEPKAYEAGYVADIHRYGGYAAYDGQAGLRSVLGYVLVRNASLTERSVLTTTNYVPVAKKVFVYQAAEIDLQGPGGQGSGGLSYFFTNARIAPTARVDIQGIYHHGRSIDARTITLDQLNGRPIPASMLEALTFQSASARVTFEVARGLRVFGGFGQERSNRDSEPATRINAGGHASNLAGSGVDATVSFSRIDRGAPGSFDSWYVSVGRSLSSKVYLSGDYTSSLSVLRVTGGNGLVVETRPQTDRYTASAIVNLTRLVSLLATLERASDTTYTDTRLLAGISYRLQ